MTTKVTVDAHAGWPVQVEAVNQYPSDLAPHTCVLETVPPHEKRDFFVHSNRKLIITEMPHEAVST